MAGKIEINVPPEHFAETKAEYEKHYALATEAKKQHDSAVDLLVMFGQPLPEGVEKIEKRGAPKKGEKDAEEVEPEKKPATAKK